MVAHLEFENNISNLSLLLSANKILLAPLSYVSRVWLVSLDLISILFNIDGIDRLYGPLSLGSILLHYQDVYFSKIDSYNSILDLP